MNEFLVVFVTGSGTYSDGGSRGAGLIFYVTS